MVWRICTEQVKQDVCIYRGNHLPRISSIYWSMSKSAPSRIPTIRSTGWILSCALAYEQPVIRWSNFNLNVVVHTETVPQVLWDSYLASLRDAHDYPRMNFESILSYFLAYKNGDHGAAPSWLRVPHCGVSGGMPRNDTAAAAASSVEAAPATRTTPMQRSARYSALPRCVSAVPRPIPDSTERNPPSGHPRQPQAGRRRRNTRWHLLEGLDPFP